MKDLKTQTIQKMDLLQLIRESGSRQFELLGHITSANLPRLLAHLHGPITQHGLICVVILPAIAYR